MKILFVEEKEAEFPDYESFRTQHPDGIILSVDGRERFETCDGGGAPILSGDKYQQWEDAETCELCSGPEALSVAP